MIEISLISGMILVQFLVIFIEVFLQRKGGEEKQYKVHFIVFLLSLFIFTF